MFSAEGWITGLTELKLCVGVIAVLSLSARCCARTVECVGLCAAGCSIERVLALSGVEAMDLFVSSSATRLVRPWFD